MFLLLFTLAAIAALVVWLTIVPSLPSVESLKSIQLQVPLRIYSADNRLLAEIGEQRRRPVTLDQIPEQLKHAFLAAEDDRFYQHPGVDWRGTLRAVWLYARSMGKGRVAGGSTITQQVARRFFLSTDYTLTRKLREMLLAFKIERELDKNEILELYLNKEFLGHRAYGIAAAAQVYYGKDPHELTLAEMAMLAGLPKAPSRDNPLTNPAAAMGRRDWILGRLLQLGHIDRKDYQQAVTSPNTAQYHGPVIELDSPWIAEMARRDVVEAVGAEAAYNNGLVATTTIRSDLQKAANSAVRSGLVDYDHRHGWRGAEAHLDAEQIDRPEVVAEHLEALRPVAGLVPALVVAADAEAATLQLADGSRVELGLDAVSWARPFLNRNAVGQAPESVDEVIGAGDIVRLFNNGEEWRLAQLPEAQAALVSLKADSGEILALVGGLNFVHSQFNRATQSRRQPGSAFKPFIYAAALDNGYTPATRINDAPVVVHDPSTETDWKPTNISRRFFGPTRLREAMVNSRNLVSVRLLMGVGLEQGRSYITRFGFDLNDLPEGPSLALGSASIAPLDLTSGFAMFANGGYRIEPHYLYSVRDRKGHIILEPPMALRCPQCEDIPPPPPLPESMQTEKEPAGPALARLELNGHSAAGSGSGPNALADSFVGPPRPLAAEQALSPQTAWLIDSMLRDVITRGTGRRALALERTDLAGKTGTTNEQRDTWFAGYGGGIVTSVWVGMDNNDPLGSQEQGARTALPIWMDFMAQALDGRPEVQPDMPVGIVSSLINPDTGERTRPGTPGAIQEWFHAGNLPELESAEATSEEADPYDIY